MKPENIILSKNGKVYLTDFGLASEVTSSLSCKGHKVEISGTLPYMAPEQYRGGKADARTDNWAMGVII